MAAALGSLSLAVLLNLTSTSTCETVDLELYLRGIAQCPQDRFGANCEHRFTKSREYLPIFHDQILPNEDGELVMHRRKCTSAWFQNWLCSLPTEARDLSGITVGKTILQRVMKTYDATMNRRKNPKREIFSDDHLSKWAWKPTANDACTYKGVEWGTNRPEAWIVSDVCFSQESNEFCCVGTQKVSVSIPVGESFIKQGEEIVRSAVHASVHLDDWNQGHSMAALWWAGQLTVHSLAGFGRCSLLAARSIQRTTSPNKQNTLGQEMNNKDENVIQNNNKRMKKKQQLYENPISIGIHVRRGDSCMRWTKVFGDATLGQGRPCFASELYVKAAKLFKEKYGVTRINLATDSANASISISNALMNEGFSVTTLTYDRSLVGGSDSSNRGKKVDKGTVYIEDRLKNADPNLNLQLVIGSLIAELEMLSSSQFLIGTSSSWVTRLTFLAMIGRSGIVPPFVFVDAPFGCLNIKKCTIK